jgi:pyruvate,orthophosphate dikinase
VLTGTLTVTSVDLVSGEETASGELTIAGARPLAFRAVRGDSVTTLSPELATRVADRLRTLDAEHGRPVRAVFAVENDAETVTRVEPAPLAGLALIRVLVERVRAGRHARAHAIARLTPADLALAGTFVLDPSATRTVVARGLAASPGAAAGRLALPADFDTASDEARILVLDDAGPEDAAAIRASVAIVATSGGLTADAAIAARALRKPCVVSAAIRLTDRDGPARGDWVTVDGSSGEVLRGALPTTWAPSSPFAAELVSWLAPAPGEAPGEALIRAQKQGAQAD